MAESVIAGKRQTTVRITTGSSIFHGWYYGANDSYNSNNVEYAEVVGTEGNVPAVCNILSWTLRVYTATSNKFVDVRLTLK